MGAGVLRPHGERRVGAADERRAGERRARDRARRPRPHAGDARWRTSPPTWPACGCSTRAAARARWPSSSRRAARDVMAADLSATLVGLGRERAAGAPRGRSHPLARRRHARPVARRLRLRGRDGLGHPLRRARRGGRGRGDDAPRVARRGGDVHRRAGTPLLRAMHAAGRVFPRGDRAPSIEPVAERDLRGALGPRPPRSRRSPAGGGRRRRASRAASTPRRPSGWSAPRRRGRLTTRTPRPTRTRTTAVPAGRLPHPTPEFP